MDRLANGFGLLEAARWYPEFGLVFSDMTRGGVFTLSPGGGTPDVLIPHRKGIGGLVAHEAGGFVVAGRNVSHKAADGATTVLLDTRADETFFNDLTADRRGRIFAGSVAVNPLAADHETHPEGRLYCIDLDGSVSVLSQDVLVSNGLGTSPGDDALYHVDSDRKVVWRFPLDAADPGSGREAFADTGEYGGVPDGLAVAADGSVWVAMAGGGVLVGWDADGRRIEEVPIPQPLVTAVCFGGADLRTLFVLTGVNDEYPDADGGSVYRVAGDRDRAGLPGAIGRVAIPAEQG